MSDRKQVKYICQICTDSKYIGKANTHSGWTWRCCYWRRGVQRPGYHWDCWGVNGIHRHCWNTAVPAVSTQPSKELISQSPVVWCSIHWNLQSLMSEIWQATYQCHLKMIKHVGLFCGRQSRPVECWQDCIAGYSWGLKHHRSSHRWLTTKSANPSKFLNSNFSEFWWILSDGKSPWWGVHATAGWPILILAWPNCTGLKGRSMIQNKSIGTLQSQKFCLTCILHIKPQFYSHITFLVKFVDCWFDSSWDLNYVFTHRCVKTSFYFHMTQSLNL